jgi:putative transposase
MEVKRTTGTVYTLNYHFVWCPKYRRDVLTEQVADRLRALLYEIAAQYRLEIVACEVMPDHVHLFVSAPPKYSPAELAKLFKGITSRRLHQELSEQIRGKVWKPGTLWSPSYYAGTAGNVSGAVIKRYIEESLHI